MEGDGRPRQDTRRRSPGLSAQPSERRGDAPAGRRLGDPSPFTAFRIVPGTPRPGGGIRGAGGLWRVTVADGSMLPAIRPGDWLLVDPTVARWPRRGTVVVFREPGSGVLAIKRVAARPGDWVRFADGWLRMGDDEAWLRGDASDEALEATGHGPAIDSRRYGPVPVDALVARAWFRYGPSPRRIGRLPRRARPTAPGRGAGR